MSKMHLVTSRATDEELIGGFADGLPHDYAFVEPSSELCEWRAKIDNDTQGG